jgi:DNA-binding response OmpR family regulator
LSDRRSPRRLVLAVEDDADIARALGVLLERNDFEVLLASDGRDGLRLFHQCRPQLVILDVGLPEMDGWTLLERVRELSDAPVLMLTARDGETDKVRGLRAGADDYLTKPFGNAELVARVEALLRRAPDGAIRGGVPGTAVAEAGTERLGGSQGSGRGGQLRIGAVRIDPEAHIVEVDGREVDLTPTEYRLLQALARHPGQVLSNEQLLRLAWQDPTATGPDRVKFTVLRLRRKLGWAEAGASPLETVRGFGYRLRT